MPRIVLALAVTLAFIFGASSALSRTSDNSVSFSDPVGDVPSDIPDITGVTVSNDERGRITFAIRIPNRPAQRADTSIAIFMDTDGDGKSDRTVQVLGDRSRPSFGTVDEKGKVHLLGYPHEWGSHSWSDGLLVIQIDGRLLAVTNGPADFQGAEDNYPALSFWPPAMFIFKVNAYADIEQYPYYKGIDVAGTWSYEVRLLRELVIKSLVAPKTVRAGKVLTVAMTVVRDDTGEVAQGKISCTALVGKKLLRLLNPPVASGSAVKPSATCSWLVPKTAKGKVVRGGIFLAVQGGLQELVATRAFAAKVK